MHPGCGTVEPVACHKMVAPLLSTVPASAADRSLLTWLAERFRYFDAAGWRAAIDQGRVLRNGARSNCRNVS